MTGQDLAEAAAAAVVAIAREHAAEVLPAGSDPGQLLAPAAALRVARQVELAARHEVSVHVRRARKDGLSWHEIGGLLDFGLLAADAPHVRRWVRVRVHGRPAVGESAV